MKTDNYPVSPRAEKILNSLATAWLVFGWIFAVAAIAAGLILGNENENPNIALGLILGAAAFLAMCYIIWAQLKVIVNISRSLYNINDAVRDLAPSPESSVISWEEKRPSPYGVHKFNVGQLVIIKSNEDQFRVSDIREANGEVIYYSGKFDRTFAEDEIEDFDEYWKAKKGR